MLQMIQCFGGGEWEVNVEKNVLGMMVFFAMSVVFWSELLYRFMMPKIIKEKSRIWIEGALIIAMVVSVVLTLYFFDGVISAL